VYDDPEDNEVDSFIGLMEAHCRTLFRASGLTTGRDCGRLGHARQRTQPYRHSLIRSDHAGGKESRGRPSQGTAPTRTCRDLDGLPGYLLSEAEYQEFCREELGMKHAKVVAE
jgi:hypothetical protein